MIRRGMIRLGLVLALLPAACAPGGDLPPLPAPRSDAYLLGPDDVLHVITFDEPQLTGDFHVGQDGTVAFPLIDVVPAAGLTVSQFAERIKEQLKQKDLLRNPSVSIQIVSYRPFFIIGEVARPGEYPYAPHMTVLSAVAVAGGFTYRAFTDYATIVRQAAGAQGNAPGSVTGDHAMEGRAARDALVEPGDVITILARHF
jgi:polysaccharide export outer membrane protein